MRGVEVLRDKRLFLAWTLAAEKDRFSTDLREFSTSFEVPPPPERPHYVMEDASLERRCVVHATEGP